jgi:hypothetical protein
MSEIVYVLQVKKGIGISSFINSCLGSVTFRHGSGSCSSDTIQNLDVDPGKFDKNLSQLTLHRFAIEKEKHQIQGFKKIRKNNECWMKES